MTIEHIPTMLTKTMAKQPLRIRPPLRRYSSSVSPSEISHFTRLSAQWWDSTGEFGLLHRMNPARIEFLRESLLRIEEVEGPRWLKGRDVLDVGCGGGIFAESLARLGAKTLGIDAAEANIRVAETHASNDPSFNSPSQPSSAVSKLLRATPSRSGDLSLEYRHCTVEELLAGRQNFDVVCAMEVLEHVEQPADFLQALMQLTKPGGLVLLSTISRTALSQLLTLTVAERVLRLVSPGTHTFSKFVTPDELQAFFDERGWPDMERRGCIYDPIKGTWRLLGMGDWWGLGEKANYFAGVKKPL